MKPSTTILQHNSHFMHHWPIMVVVVLAVSVYFRVTGHDFIFNWDDAKYVSDNKAVQGFSWQHLQQIFTSCYVGNYAPVQMLSYMADYSVWGLAPGGFLITNILLHVSNGLILYGMMIRWYGSRLAASAAAGLFLLHPVQVESVAWVSQRKNLLSLFFFLIAWLCYCQYRSSIAEKARSAYALSLIVFVAALLSKSAAVVLPLILLLYDFSFIPGNRPVRLKDKIPFFIAAGMVAALTMYIQQAEFGGGRADFHGGGPLATFFTMLTVFCRYLWMLVWPAGLSAMYDPAIHTTPDFAVIAAASVFIAIGVAVWLFFKRDRRLCFWVFFFFVALLPVSQIIPLVTLMNDRYLYFPMIAIAALFGVGASYARERVGQGAVAVVAIVLCLCAATSFQRAAVWHDPLTLWSDAVEKSPGSSYSWSSLAEVYFRELRVNEAVEAYEKSLELNPENRMTISALGPIYTELGDLDRGYDFLIRYLKIRPDDIKGLAYLGTNYLRRGDTAGAERMYRQALAIKPDSKRVVFLLGNFLMEQRRYTEADLLYGQAEALLPGDPEIAYQLACAKSMSGLGNDALTWLESALKRGYRDYVFLKDDPNLAGLRDSSELYTLLERYGAGQGREQGVNSSGNGAGR